MSNGSTSNGSAANHQVAVFIDFENIAISAEKAYGECKLAPVLAEAEAYGRCVIKRAYSDWTRFAGYRQQLIDHSIELIQLFTYGAQQSKNAADIQMVVDALETAFRHPDIGIFVLVSGDSDYSAVARKLRSYGKQVMGIGQRDATSEMLVKACDRFTLYDTLVEPRTRTTAFALQRARQLMQDTLRDLARATAQGRVWAATLKNAMLRRDPTFNEVNLGFAQFKDFLRDQTDWVELIIPANGGDLQVMLKAAAAALPADDSAEYRLAWDAAGLQVLEPHTRMSILQDLYGLLQREPGQHTLEDAVQRLKEQYDTTNVLRTGSEVNTVARLIKSAQVVEPPVQSWELDPIALRPGLTLEEFVDRCESVYAQVLLEKKLGINPDALALLLFGTLDQRARVEELATLARQRLLHSAGMRPTPSGWDWAPSLRDNPTLAIALADLHACEPTEAPSLARASELARKGMETRNSDFQQAARYFLEAAKMLQLLLQQGEAGASPVELEWYLASHCASTAGANYLARRFGMAAPYYLAFFVIARDTAPVWDKLRGLVSPMLSYYFAITASQNRCYLHVAPGHTDPAFMAATLQLQPDPQVLADWKKLSLDLARVNPPLVRSVIHDLKELEARSVPGAAQARATLCEALDQAESPEPDAPPAGTVESVSSPASSG